MKTHKTSQLNKFYKKTIEERKLEIKAWSNLSKQTDLSIEDANNMIENVVSTFRLPFAVATNFLVNEKDYLIPMVIEEPSVVAAVSFAGKLFRESGGFKTSSTPPIMIGQIQILDIIDIESARIDLEEKKQSILIKANEVGGSIVKRGGGAVDIQIRAIEHPIAGSMLILHLHYDCRDAMGANAINTALEHIAPMIEKITRGRVNLKILSNLSTERRAFATGMILANSLKRHDLSGNAVASAIVEAGILAEIDPYRATTHNKGIMNGIDAVVLATGNDWRAVEAGAHAFAARHGTYRSLTKWWQDEAGNLHGSIDVPLAVGIVGGATRVHPKAQTALEILGVKSAQELAEVIAAVGLAQNFAAIRALATEGIQKGHMRMHARQLAAAAGAVQEAIPMIVEHMIEENNIRLERAKELVQLWIEEH